MPVYLPTSVVGNSNNLVTLGGSGEVMAWFFPHKDAFQHITACLPCVYFGHGQQGQLHFTFEPHFSREQSYFGDSNILRTYLKSGSLELEFEDVMLEELPVLARRIRVSNRGNEHWNGGIYHLNHWKMGGHHEGNGVRFDFEDKMIVQNHREYALAVGGDALEGHHLGKAGANWGNNARYALERGVLAGNELEIGDVNFAAGFYVDLAAGETQERTLFFSLGHSQTSATSVLWVAMSKGFGHYFDERVRLDTAFLERGLNALKEAEHASLNNREKVAGAQASANPASAHLDAELTEAFKRSLLALPLLQGEEGAAVAAPEFDPEFIACGGYGYHWPRDGGEYVSGLLDAGYPEFARGFFKWCARHQDHRGLWHQRYHLNGQLAPNWCLPPDTLQIDEVGAVGWALGKTLASLPDFEVTDESKTMLARASDYLLTRLDEQTGVHKNAFDTWETFIGSFTYSNAAIYAHLVTSAQVCENPDYAKAAARLKAGVLKHFTRESKGIRFLVRGFKSDGSPDDTIDSANLGAIEPFGLLDLSVDAELDLAIGTLRIITERLEVEWQGGRAIRRFEGDEYVGGVPACVNTLWMARCCLHVAAELQRRGRNLQANVLIERAEGFLKVVLKRATPTGLLPELMQGPEGQTFWAAPHGWAMASFVSGVLKLARVKAQ
jgi:oligosaccharide amylase